jgi:hypothetical protein
MFVSFREVCYWNEYRSTPAVVDLFSKYPGADRVAIITTMLSTTCVMIRNSKQLTDAQKFDKWIAVLPVIRTFLPQEKRSQYIPPVLDLGSLELGMQKVYADKLLGTPRTFRPIEIRADEPDPKTGVFEWYKKREYYYRRTGLDIRIIYDDDGLASSIFVGLGADENSVSLVSTQDWPGGELNRPVRWSSLRFIDVGDRASLRRHQ